MRGGRAFVGTHFCGKPASTFPENAVLEDAMAGRWSRGWSMARASYAVLKRHPSLLVFRDLGRCVAGGLRGDRPHRSCRSRSHARRHPWNLGQARHRWDRKYLVLRRRLHRNLCAHRDRGVLQCRTRPLRPALPRRRGAVGRRRHCRSGRCLPQILGWALVSTTVGVVLNAIENCSGTSSASSAA